MAGRLPPVVPAVPVTGAVTVHPLAAAAAAGARLGGGPSGCQVAGEPAAHRAVGGVMKAGRQHAVVPPRGQLLQSQPKP